MYEKLHIYNYHEKIDNLYLRLQTFYVYFLDYLSFKKTSSTFESRILGTL